MCIDWCPFTKYAAYLMGCPIRGVILDPIVAVQMGIQGQVISGLLCASMPFQSILLYYTQQLMLSVQANEICLQLFAYMNVCLYIC